jgi:hypothetical protein
VVLGAENASEEPACAAHALAFSQKKNVADAGDDYGPAEEGAFVEQVD